MTETTIPETAVGEVAGIRVAVGNVWEEEYTSEDGVTQTGPTATLFVMGDTPDIDFDARVHVGQQLQIGPQWVRVTRIYEPPDTPGSVTLTLIEAP